MSVDLGCRCPLLDSERLVLCEQPATQEDGMCDACRERCRPALNAPGVVGDFTRCIRRVIHACEWSGESARAFIAAYTEGSHPSV